MFKGFNFRDLPVTQKITYIGIAIFILFILFGVIMNSIWS